MATKGVTCSYQEVIDLHTEPDHVTVIGIHTPTGDTPRKMFRGFFDQYKKYKYLGASVKLVPAARLPADMLQVSYGAGDYIDPRDNMNPIMFHGCHGDDMGTILNRLYNSQDPTDSLGVLDITPNALNYLETAEYDQWERLYYKALTDNTWKKAHPQRGFIKSGLRLLIYQLATNHQLMPGTKANAMIGGVRAEFLDSVGSPDTPTSEGTYGTDLEITDPVLNDSMFFTPKLIGLGWMDTRNVLTKPASAEAEFDSQSTPQHQIDLALNAATISQINYAELPKLYMGVVLLSKMYKVAQYYRMIINHRFAFKDFRSISFMPEQSGVPSYFNANTSDGILDPETFEDFPEGA